MVMDNEPFMIYLDSVTTPGRKARIVKAVNVLDTIGVQSIHLMIAQYIETDIGDNEILEQIEHFLEGAISATLGQFGIQISDQCPFDVATAILNGMVLIEDWDNPSEIQVLCEQDTSAEAVLSDILERVEVFTHDDFYANLTRVNPALIDTIDDACTTYLPGALPPADVMRRADARIHRYLEVIKPPILSKAIGDLILFGASFKATIDQYETEISALEMERAVEEIFGFALISEVEDADIEKTVREEMQGWWEAATVMKVDAQIRRLVKDFATPPAQAEGANA